MRKSNLYSKVQKKEIPFYKIGNLLRFCQEEIDVWLESKKSQPAESRQPTRRVMQTNRAVNMDINRLVDKSIAEARGSRYNSTCGKPGQVRSLGKEAKDGAV